MKWNNKDISDLTDTELIEASKSIIQMHENFTTKRNSPEYAEKLKQKSKPEINPSFLLLTDEINTELKKRNVSQ